MTKRLLRQYFFHIDFKGLLYLQQGGPYIFANAVKDKKFLSQFYNNLKKCNPIIHPLYPYVSDCWGEQNYVKCDIVPAIFTYLENGKLSYSFEQVYDFMPESMRIDKKGYIFHEFKDMEGTFSNQLLAKLTDKVTVEDGKSYFQYEGGKYCLDKDE